ncbi:phenol 2-monooxygenase [Colletotrichum tofieldiae]|nr:phenol 2-monooxygenase [Colletotrichum tofieldiae]
MSEECDVLICGSGSAGLCAAVWLARCGINFKILERREGLLKQGQADGVQVRTVEILEHLGLSEDVLKEAYHVLELAFWSPDETGGIRRSHLEPDTEPGLSHLPHVILNQARINELLIQDIIYSSGESHIRYGSDICDVIVNSEAARDPNAHCVTVKSIENGVERTYRAKYALGCDGAHSAVRKSLGFKMIGDSTDVVWAVMDIYPRTDFPDIRKKCVLQSDAGNLVIIPREGDEKVRFYMEMPLATPGEVTPEKVKERLDGIFKPYQVEIAETSWFSAYSIGQRLADHFTKDNRVFLTGDACHTHSPKAGQGMNVSLQDGYNIGWKLAAVLRGQAQPSILETYVSERHQTAKDLIDFDRQFAKMFSSSYRREHGYSTKDFQEYFIKSGRYTAGLATQYKPSMLVGASGCDDLARGMKVGMRFSSAQVVRFSDARAMQLSQALHADSRWSLIIFAGDVAQRRSEERLYKNIFVDDISYHAGHGEAYAKYGVDPEVGAMILVRPDQCESHPIHAGAFAKRTILDVSGIYALENTEAISNFFESFFVCKTNGFH